MPNSPPDAEKDKDPAVPMNESMGQISKSHSSK